MKHPNENPLLKEVLTDERLTSLRQFSLDEGLAAMRRARRHRRVARVGALALAPALLWLALTQTQRERGRESASLPLAATQSASVAAAPVNSGVELISDEQLFALFPGRSMALIGKPGQQQLVFLDAAKAGERTRYLKKGI
jgi:hypothetical protein